MYYYKTEVFLVSSTTVGIEIEADKLNYVSYLNYNRIAHTKISSTQPVYLRIQRGDMFRRSQSHPQAIHQMAL
jgi:hypothetical protein